MKPPIDTPFTEHRTDPRTFEPIPSPKLSDDAVIQIHDFIHHVLDLFEARYGDQLHRFYEDLFSDCRTESDSNLFQDDPPF